MPSQYAVPPELILNVLFYSDHRDVVRWRTVSKGFCAITHSDSLWRSIYANATVLRPPGPSPHQSSTYLERALVKSVQLAETWPHRPMREVSSATVTLGLPLPMTSNKLIAGRWLIGCEDARRFVLHDADARSQVEPKVLWEREELVVAAWDLHAVSPVVGQSLVYVLVEHQKTETLFEWTLLEFRLRDESGEIYASATVDAPSWARSPLSEVVLRGGQTRFLFIRTETPEGVVFDTSTRAFYALPEHHVALSDTIPEQFRESSTSNRRMEFTEMHIVSLQCRRTWFRGTGTLIQIYALPSDDAEDHEAVPCLRLTHEGFSDERLFSIAVMKPCVDLAGVTTLRLLEYCIRFDKLNVMIVDLTLPNPTGPDVTPMHVNDRTLVRIPKDGINMDRYTHSCVYLDACDGERMRGFFRGKRRQKAFDKVENQNIVKFAIDTRQEPWAVERGGLAPAEWKDAADATIDQTGRVVVFDGLRGRLCYAHPKVKNQVVVVDVE